MADLKKVQNKSTSDYWVTLPDGRKVWKGAEQGRAYIPGTGWVDLADLDIPQEMEDAIQDDPQFGPGVYGWTPGGWIQTHDQDLNPVDQDPNPDPPQEFWWNLIQDDEWILQSPTGMGREVAEDLVVQGRTLGLYRGMVDYLEEEMMQTIDFLSRTF